jgi:hypothetical protein
VTEARQQLLLTYVGTAGTMVCTACTILALLGSGSTTTNLTVIVKSRDTSRMVRNEASRPCAVGNARDAYFTHSTSKVRKRPSATERRAAVCPSE